MIGLLCFALAVLASPFKSKSRLEAQNAVLRHQLIVLRRRLKGRARLTNNDQGSSSAGSEAAGTAYRLYIFIMFSEWLDR